MEMIPLFVDLAGVKRVNKPFASSVNAKMMHMTKMIDDGDCEAKAVIFVANY